MSRERALEIVGVMLGNWKAAAVGGAASAERRDHHAAPGLTARVAAVVLGLSQPGTDEKVVDRAVVPHIEPGLLVERSGVFGDPPHVLSAVSQAAAASVKCHL